MPICVKCLLCKNMGTEIKIYLKQLESTFYIGDRSQGYLYIKVIIYELTKDQYSSCQIYSIFQLIVSVPQTFVQSHHSHQHHFCSCFH